MERDELLFSWIKALVVLVAIAGLVAGCAISARDLPLDYSSVDAKKRWHLDDFDPETVKLTCEEIDKELKILESDSATQVRHITDKSASNQAAYYIGFTFFLPALFITDNSTELKKKIENINRAKDELYKLRAFKKCPSHSIK